MTPADHTRGSILVVDDEPTIADIVSRYLRKAGFDTRVAGDGLDAVAQAEERRPDLMVLDVTCASMTAAQTRWPSSARRPT